MAFIGLFYEKKARDYKIGGKSHALARFLLFLIVVLNTSTVREYI